MEDTYLNPEAMLRRIESMQNQAETIFKEIEKTRAVMERLKKYFMGVSADRLQKKFEELASTYRSLHEYLNEQAQLMSNLTTNTKQADEEA